MILLARHGQTSDNAAGRILGHRDPPLSPEGRSQAIELAQSVARQGLRALWTSPLLRARQTADIVAIQIALQPVVLDQLIESRRGAWEGMTYAELSRRYPTSLAAFEDGERSFAFPGGESLEEQIARTGAALTEIADGPIPALAIAHAGTIRAALAVHRRPLPRERDIPHGRVIRFDAPR